MFNNVNVGSADATISTKWTWNYIPGNPLPKCSYFSCCLKEDVFLNKSLFLEKEILDYFEKEVLKVIGSDRVRYAVYEGNKIYLLNTDYDLPVTVKVVCGDRAQMATLESLELKVLEL